MSKRFSDFPNVNPPQDTDVFLIGRPDGSPNGYSNYTITGADLKTWMGVPTVDAFFLQNDGASFFLLNDGVSKLKKNS